MNNSRIRVFIGSGEASLLERKVLIYTLRKFHPGSDLDIYVFNGTHNSIEKNDEPPVLAPLSLRVKYKNFTEFSNYRFIIPQICNYEGRAIFMDSDTICFADVADLFNADMQDNDFLSKGDAYKHIGDKRWGLSVSLFDCSKCKFDVETYFDEIDKGLFTNTDLHQMTAAFLAHHPFKIGEIDTKWNDFDNYDSSTKLIHYTNLITQPWKYSGHPHEELWFNNFSEARKAGYITDEEIQKSILRAYVRKDLFNPEKIQTNTVPGIKAATKNLLKAVKSKVF